jgi:two-component system nitrogen regulation response regulator GlnG
VRAIAQAEQVLIEAALEHTEGAKAEAAMALGWGRNTLTRKLK